MKKLGFSGKITELIKPDDWDGFQLARVIAEHKERYIIQTYSEVFHAEITGNLRYTAKSRLDFPAVGDWVKITMMDKETAIILNVFPRFSVLERQAVGITGGKQILAANIDSAFIVQSVGQDFNLKRLERYLTVCNAAQIEPVILLTKIDLIHADQVKELTRQINDRIKNVPVIPLSMEMKERFEVFAKIFKPYKTYCFIGSSGVGKSTIVNYLKGSEILKTNTISTSTNKGRHTTSHRELIILPNESIVVDTPGMREIGMVDNQAGIEMTYDNIIQLSETCRFNDCSHTNEMGCSVLKAVEHGEISQSAYDNYQKLKREHDHFTTSVVGKRQKSKNQGKLFKSIKSARKKNKF